MIWMLSELEKDVNENEEEKTSRTQSKLKVIRACNGNRTYGQCMFYTNTKKESRRDFLKRGNVSLVLFERETDIHRLASTFV